MDREIIQVIDAVLDGLEPSIGETVGRDVWKDSCVDDRNCWIQFQGVAGGEREDLGNGNGARLYRGIFNDDMNAVRSCWFCVDDSAFE